MWHRFRQLFRSFLRPAAELSLGEKGEQAAVNFLRKQKRYRIADRNVRFPFGEIDVVAVDDRTIVFVEVKTRSTTVKGEPFEAVGPDKQAKLLELGEAYLKKEGLEDQRARFDIVSVTWQDETQLPSIEHLIDAFRAPDVGDAGVIDVG